MEKERLYILPELLLSSHGNLEAQVEMVASQSKPGLSDDNQQNASVHLCWAGHVNKHSTFAVLIHQGWQFILLSHLINPGGFGTFLDTLVSHANSRKKRKNPPLSHLCWWGGNIGCRVWKHMCLTDEIQLNVNKEKLPRTCMAASVHFVLQELLNREYRRQCS